MSWAVTIVVGLWVVCAYVCGLGWALGGVGINQGYIISRDVAMGTCLQFCMLIVSIVISM
jgi:hypothetical protein